MILLYMYMYMYTLHTIKAIARSIIGRLYVYLQKQILHDFMISICGNLE